MSFRNLVFGLCLVVGFSFFYLGGENDSYPVFTEEEKSGGRISFSAFQEALDSDYAERAISLLRLGDFTGFEPGFDLKLLSLWQRNFGVEGVSGELLGNPELGIWIARRLITPTQIPFPDPAQYVEYAAKVAESKSQERVRVVAIQLLRYADSRDSIDVLIAQLSSDEEEIFRVSASAVAENCNISDSDYSAIVSSLDSRDRQELMDAYRSDGSSRSHCRQTPLNQNSMGVESIERELSLLVAKDAINENREKANGGNRQIFTYFVLRTFPDRAIPSPVFGQLATLGWRRCEPSTDDWVSEGNESSPPESKAEQLASRWINKNTLLTVIMLHRLNRETSDSEVPTQQEVVILFDNLRDSDLLEQARLTTVDCVPR